MRKPSPNSTLQARLQHVISIVLVLAVAGMLGWLSIRYDYQADWTANNSNTLGEGSRKLLATLKGPVLVTAYVYPDQNVRREISALVDRYRRLKPDIALEFVDPAKAPDKVRELGISGSGEVVVEYQGRRENLRVLGEQSFSTALQRLAYSGESWIVFLEGHGERNINGREQADFGALADELRKKGLKVQGLNLAATPSVPDNAAALVIADPQRRLLPGEVRLVRDYVARGGSLLWLQEPEGGAGLDQLATDLQVQWQKGTLIYPDFQILGTGHPAIALVLEYGASPITRDLLDITLFPFAGAVKARDGGAWQATPFLQSPERSWLETGPLGENIALEESKGDLRGPLALGLALQRTHPDAAKKEAGRSAEELLQQKEPPAQQRVVLVADSDFMANASLGNLGNLQLSLNIIQWLAQRDAQISVHIPPAPDAQLFLPPWAFIIITVAFVAALPLLLLLTGVGRWWLRRRR